MINGNVIINENANICLQIKSQEITKMQKITLILIDSKKDENTYSSTKFFGLFQMSHL